MNTQTTNEQLIKIARTISNHAFVATLSRTNVDPANKNNPQEREKTYLLYDPSYKYQVPGLMLVNQQLDLVPNLGTDNESMLFSVLTNQTNQNLVKAQLIKLCQLTSSAKLNSDWQLKLLTTEFQGFILINAFLTNNEQPQFIHLTRDIIKALYLDPDDVAQPEQWQNLLADSLVYNWHTEQPSKIYQKQIVNLADPKDLPKILAKIDALMPRFMAQSVLYQQKAFKNAFSTVITKELKTKKHKNFNYEPLDVINTINVFDLDWFLSNLNNYPQKRTIDFKTLPEVKQAVNSLASELA